MDPAVMLFDEPTSALDPELVGEVLRVIRHLAEEGRTMIVVTHEMGFAREVSSETVFLHEGRVEEQGSPQEVFSNPRSQRFRQFLERSEEHTSELQSLMRISYAVFCLKKNKHTSTD